MPSSQFCLRVTLSGFFGGGKSSEGAFTPSALFSPHSITNLKYWGRCEPITSKTLQLLNDLSIGYPLKQPLLGWCRGSVAAPLGCPGKQAAMGQSQAPSLGGSTAPTCRTSGPLTAVLCLRGTFSLPLSRYANENKHFPPLGLQGGLGSFTVAFRMSKLQTPEWGLRK